MFSPFGQHLSFAADTVPLLTCDCRPMGHISSVLFSGNYRNLGLRQLEEHLAHVPDAKPCWHIICAPAVLDALESHPGASQPLAPNAPAPTDTLKLADSPLLCSVPTSDSRSVVLQKRVDGKLHCVACRS